MRSLIGRIQTNYTQIEALCRRHFFVYESTVDICYYVVILLQVCTDIYLTILLNFKLSIKKIEKLRSNICPTLRHAILHGQLKIGGQYIVSTDLNKQFFDHVLNKI